MVKKKGIKWVVKRDGMYWPSEAMKSQANMSDKNIYNKAAKNPIKFWENCAREGLVWNKKWDVAYEEKLPYFKWFKGGELNFCVNCVDRHLDQPNKVAMIWVPEPTEEKKI